jgi:hypothetical protein
MGEQVLLILLSRRLVTSANGVLYSFFRPLYLICFFLDLLSGVQILLTMMRAIMISDDQG